jgi:hypothetical protein
MFTFEDVVRQRDCDVLLRGTPKTWTPHGGREAFINEPLHCRLGALSATNASKRSASASKHVLIDHPAQPASWLARSRARQAGPIISCPLCAGTAAAPRRRRPAAAVCRALPPARAAPPRAATPAGNPSNQKSEDRRAAGAARSAYRYESNNRLTTNRLRTARRRTRCQAVARRSCECDEARMMWLVTQRPLLRINRGAPARKRTDTDDRATTAWEERHHTMSGADARYRDTSMHRARVLRAVPAHQAADTGPTCARRASARSRDILMRCLRWRRARTARRCTRAAMITPSARGAPRVARCGPAFVACRCRLCGRALELSRLCVSVSVQRRRVTPRC